MNSRSAYLHSHAVVESSNVGKGTRVWAFAHILPGAKIGEDCNVCDHVFIENDVVIGDRVTIKCGVQLWDGIRIEDDVFIGPNATFTNDTFPRSKQYPAQFSTTVLKRGSSIGANATILPCITVGERAMVGAGSVVTRDVPPYAVVVGNPARIIGYEGLRHAEELPATAEGQTQTGPTSVRGVVLHRLPSAADMRGRLSFGEVDSHVPFEIKRYFLVYNVPTKEIRGEHAHRTLHQFLICVHGKCSVMADDGVNRQEFQLDNPTIGLHIAPCVWAVQYKHSADAVLLVFASDYYDPHDYVRDYSAFLEMVKETAPR
jgi:UDP-2-acetamido-3-amino-2,3-dideoxy-glucuronate N-acetyltransferase